MESVMTIQKALEQVQFVIGADGQPTTVLVEITAWQMLVEFG
jgi:hypothetical protein